MMGTKKDIYMENNQNWKGDRITDNKGYVYIYVPNHPFSLKGDQNRP